VALLSVTCQNFRFEARGVLTNNPLAVAFCGSGYGPLIDKLVDECWKAAEPLDSLDDVSETIERTIKGLNKEYGEIYQAGQCPSVELIYGIKTAEGSKLFSSNGPIVNERPDYFSSGAGYYMADFLASRMYAQYLTVHQCVILAAYILYQAKEHVDGCGGDSHIAVLRSDGGADGLVDSARVQAMTDILVGVDSNFGRIALSAANLELAESEIVEDIEHFRDALKHFRTVHQNRIKEKDSTGIAVYLARAFGTEPLSKDAFGLPVYPKKETT
jgi:hypothetical protein